MNKKKQQKYPTGWDEVRVRKLAEDHVNQTDDEVMAEIEFTLKLENQTVTVVSTELAPETVKLIDKKRSA